MLKLSELGASEQSLYLRVASIEHRKSKQGVAFLSLRLADLSATFPATLFHDHDSYGAAKKLEPGKVVAVRACLGSYRGAPQLEVSKLRELDERDEGRWDPANLYGAALARVKDLATDKLVMDIETAPLHEVRGLPPTLVEEVTRVAKDKDWPIDKVLGLNPLFSRVVSIAVGSADGDGGCVLLSPPDDRVDAIAAEAPDWMRVMKESEMLESFWSLAAAASLVITFNGRSFDLPFLRNRSAILGVPVTLDLVSQPPFQHAPHLDLYAILSGGGWGARPMNLDAACFAFGIESPKDAMDGSMVGQAFHDGRYEEIAKYNLADIDATRALYHKFAKTVLPYLRD